jgi:hypothetical protein
MLIKKGIHLQVDHSVLCIVWIKVKAIPLQAWTGP